MYRKAWNTQKSSVNGWISSHNPVPVPGSQPPQSHLVFEFQVISYCILCPVETKSGPRMKPIEKSVDREDMKPYTRVTPRTWRSWLFMCLFPTLCLIALCLWLEIHRLENIYTREISKCYKPGLLFPPESWELTLISTPLDLLCHPQLCHLLVT